MPELSTSMLEPVAPAAAFDKLLGHDRWQHPTVLPLLMLPSG